MLMKTVTYKDYNGVEKTRDLYFNLSEAELFELQWTKDGGYSEWAKRIINAKKETTLMQVFKEILLKSYGEKSDDGEHFRKSQQITEDFYNSPAYNIIFMELVTDDKAAADFFNRVVPEEISQKASKMIEQSN